MTYSNRTVIVFSGRQHHYERLSPVVNALRAKGVNVSYCISENAIQLDTSLEYLIPANEQFIHAQGYLAESDIPKVTEMAHWMLSQVGRDTSNFVSPFWMAFTMREVAEVVVSFRNMLTSQKPECVLILHEANYWGKALAYLCHEVEIPCISFQEGHLRHRDQTTQGKFALSCGYSTKVLMWSDGAKQAYVNSGISAEKLEVVGIPHLDKWLTLLLETPKDGFAVMRQAIRTRLGLRNTLPLVTFALPQLGRYDGSPMKAIGLLSDWSADHPVQLAIRFHPFEAEETVRRVRDALVDHPRARVIEDGETVSLVLASDAVISQHTTIAVEALAMGVPLIEIDVDNVGVLECLAGQGVAVPIISKADFSKITDVVSGKLSVECATLHQWLESNIGPRDGKSTERAVQSIGRYL